MHLPDIYLQPHVAGGNPVLVAHGQNYELSEEEKVLWLKILVDAVQPNQIVAKVCAPVVDE